MAFSEASHREPKPASLSHKIWTLLTIAPKNYEGIVGIPLADAKAGFVRGALPSKPAGLTRLGGSFANWGVLLWCPWQIPHVGCLAWSVSKRDSESGKN